MTLLKWCNFQKIENDAKKAVPSLACCFTAVPAAVVGYKVRGLESPLMQAPLIYP